MVCAGAGEMTRVRLALFLAGTAAFAILAIHAGMATVIRMLGLLQPVGFAIITAIHLPVIILMGLAWWTVGQDARGATPAKFMAARLVRDSVAEILPFSQIGGFLSGLRLLHLLGLDRVTGALSMLADLTIEFAAKLAYALAGVLALAILIPGEHPLRPFFLALASVLVVLATITAFRKQIRCRLENMAARMAARWSPLRYHDTGADFGRFFAWRRSLPNFAIHTGCWLFGAVEAWVTFRLMGLAVTGPQALSIDSLGTALRTFGFLVPAAMGVQEAGYVLVCGLFGVGPAEAVAFSLARRARDLALGLPGLMVWQFFETRAYRRRAMEQDVSA
jgi:putative membrane protein